MTYKKYSFRIRVCSILLIPILLGFIQQQDEDLAALRRLYQQSSDKWPKASIDSGIKFQELGPLPQAPLQTNDPSSRALINLGKMLFFDPRLSGSMQISCSSCHDPDMHWTDGRIRAIGHNHRQGARNTPSVAFSWANKRLFWDGRAGSLEEQTKGSLSNPKEMNADLATLPQKMHKIDAYKTHFMAAFATDRPDLDQLVHAIATFERSIKTSRTAFDKFMLGDSLALTDKQIHGLHLFRTKARCINCHSGPLFTDQEFHNIGFTLYGEQKEDLGLYNYSKRNEDVGKFKTPSLRNVTRTGPWLHNGMFQDLRGLINTYNNGMPHPKRKEHQKDDPLFPETSVHLKPLQLSVAERDAILAFLESISSLPYPVNRPIIPGLDE